MEATQQPLGYDGPHDAIDIMNPIFDNALDPVHSTDFFVPLSHTPNTTGDQRHLVSSQSRMQLPLPSVLMHLAPPNADHPLPLAPFSSATATASSSLGAVLEPSGYAQEVEDEEGEDDDDVEDWEDKGDNISNMFSMAYVNAFLLCFSMHPA
jgi:hypothetical protein